MLQSYHQNAEQFEFLFNKAKLDAMPQRLRLILENAVEAASADMSWKAVDRYSQDYVEMQTKDKVRFFKTPDPILKKQLEIYDEIVLKKSRENPLFKEVLLSQIAFAKRAVQWEQDTVTNRRMAYDHYFGANGAARKLG
jgi:TRAP-type mannitol/chloroaromatic compound transport system substrate-binding protein